MFDGTQGDYRGMVIHFLFSIIGRVVKCLPLQLSTCSVIKEADKGAAVVVMNADFYVKKKIEEIITVSNSYESLVSLPTNIDKQVMNNLKKIDFTI